MKVAACILVLRAVAAVTGQAQSGFYRPLTLARADGGAEAGGTQPTQEPPPADQTHDLAKTLLNPVASLISVPFQNDFDFGAGPNGDGFTWKMNIQPVIPVSISKEWNLITRVILPVISQTDVAGTRQNPSGTQTGLGDTLTSFFFSPKAPGPGGLIWGVGPALYLPTATDDLLGAEKWGAGPTAVLLKQAHGWTYGILVNHIWSYAGEDSRSDLSSTYLQPFLAYTTKKSTTFAVNTESSYNWNADHDRWTVPVNVFVNQLVTIGRQPIQFQVGGRYYAEAPDNGPEWGLRFTVTFLFPER